MPRALLAVALLAAGCVARRTELVLGLATDLGVPAELVEVRLTVEDARGDRVRADPVRWSLVGSSGARLPGSYGIYAQGATAPLRITVAGYPAAAPGSVEPAPEPTVTRRAVLGL